jgi:hypothetical protein
MLRLDKVPADDCNQDRVFDLVVDLEPDLFDIPAVASYVGRHEQINTDQQRGQHESTHTMSAANAKTRRAPPSPTVVTFGILPEHLVSPETAPMTSLQSCLFR